MHSSPVSPAPSPCIKSSRGNGDNATFKESGITNTPTIWRSYILAHSCVKQPDPIYPGRTTGQPGSGQSHLEFKHSASDSDLELGNLEKYLTLFSSMNRDCMFLKILIPLANLEPVGTNPRSGADLGFCTWQQVILLANL
jgi:hypothetical protein